jgi:hypothetical protein
MGIGLVASGSVRSEMRRRPVAVVTPSMVNAGCLRFSAETVGWRT